MSELLIPDAKAVGIAEEYRRRKATSVLAIVFTDIADSTRLREEEGEIHYERLREDFDAQFSEIIGREDAGAVVKGTGDGALAVFSEPSTAIERCLEIQEKLRQHPKFRLRIGIDMGQVSVKSSFGIVADVFGRQVNRAARIEALAEPGHTLTSFHIYDCAVGWLKGTNIGWHNHGAVPLKGFADEISIHEVYDPRHVSPQNSDSFPRTPLPMFSRGAVRKTRPVRMSGVEWFALYEDMKLHPIKVRPASSTWSDDPFSDYAKRIKDAVETLVQSAPEIPAILWVDDFPDNNIREHQVIREAGCTLDLITTTEQAKEQLSKNRYFLIISDMGRAESATAGLDLVQWQRARGIAVPILIYASPPAIATYGEEAIAQGCTFCTAGVVSLLDAIHQILREFQYRIPFEYIDVDPAPPPVSPKRPDSRWLSRLRRLLRD